MRVEATGNILLKMNCTICRGGEGWGECEYVSNGKKRSNILYANQSRWMVLVDYYESFKLSRDVTM